MIFIFAGYAASQLRGKVSSIPGEIYLWESYDEAGSRPRLYDLWQKRRLLTTVALFVVGFVLASMHRD